MPRKKPKLDEYRIHLQYIEKLMGKYRRIGIFAPAGEGKTTVINVLRKKFEDTEWNFYDNMDDTYSEPYVYAFIAMVEDIPEFDAIYTLTYSTDYKESITGVVFNDGMIHTMEEYSQAAERRHLASLNLLGKYVKSDYNKTANQKLERLLAGEDVAE